MKYVYDYEFTVSTEDKDFNSRNTRPVAYTGYVNGAADQNVAVARFMAENFPVIRKNGIVRGEKQLLSRLSIRRIGKRVMKKIRNRKKAARA